MEPEVREQFLQAQSRLQTALADSNLKGSDLGGLFGEQGQLYLAYEYERTALRCFAIAQQLVPDDFRWSYYLGYLHHKIGKPEESRSHYERALELNPNYLPTYIRLGALLIEANQLDEAERLLNSARGQGASRVSALLGLGQIASIRGQYTEAVAYLDTALSLEPGATEINYSLGLAYRALGDLEKARYFLKRQGSRKARLDDPLLDGLNNFFIGSHAFKQRADYANLQNHFEVARTFYQRAVDASPDNPEFRLNLASTLIQLNELDSATEQLAVALRLDPESSMANYNYAVILMRQGKYNEGVLRLQKALELNPEYKEAHFNLASAFLRLGRLEEAIAHFGQVVAVDPLHESACFGQAVALMRIEYWQEASALLEVSHAALPNNTQIANAFARLLAACPIDSLRDGQRALEIARKLVASDRSLHNVEVLAMALAETGNFKEAMHLQEEALAAVRQARRHNQEESLTVNLSRYKQRQAARSPLAEISR